MVSHDLNEFAGMKCALFAIHTLETMTAGFYCPAGACRWDPIDISIQGKVAEKGSERVGFFGFFLNKAARIITIVAESWRFWK